MKKRIVMMLMIGIALCFSNILRYHTIVFLSQHENSSLTQTISFSEQITLQTWDMGNGTAQHAPVLSGFPSIPLRTLSPLFSLKEVILSRKITIINHICFYYFSNVFLSQKLDSCYYTIFVGKLRC